MSAAAPPLLNGILPGPHQNINEALEYEKILKLRDEVFAGSHPRLTVPAHALRNFSPRPPQPNSQSSLAVPSPFPATVSPNQLAIQQPNHAAASPSPLPASVAFVRPQSSVPATSDFDPVLLEKSNDLLQAEIKIKRQRLEKTLKEQFEQKRLEARRRPAPSEAKPDFDVSTILAKVLEELKPSSAKEDADASDSFDENSFYSSKAPDSTPERGRPSPSQNGDEEDIDADAPSGPRMQSAVMGAPLHAKQDHGPSPHFVPREPHNEMMDVDDDEEEGEYSPPEAMEDENGLVHPASSAMHDGHDPRGRPLRRYSEIDDGKRPTSPNMRIVRNHITSPIAPQPSRVSPLALAKDAPFQQNTRMRRQRQGQGGSPEPMHPRKKRKMDKKERRARRNGGLSPDAFIKEENVSPPPFHEVQPLGTGRMRPTHPDRPIVIDDGPQEVRYVAPDGRYIDSQTRPDSRHMEPQMPHSEPRVVSRTAMRPMRDDQDLRRVASLHNMRTEQPREYADSAYATPARRVASYRESSPVVADRQRHAVDGGAYYDPPPMQEVRVSRTPGPAYQDAYREEQPQVRYELMPPQPVERIVVDEFGRRFREIIQPPPERLPVAPPRAMSVRPTEARLSSYDNYRGSRAGSVFVEAPPERRYAQEMAPPPPTYRQVDQAPRASAAPMGQPRDPYEQAGTMRSASIQVVDRPGRQPVYMDDRVDFREPVRMGSVRPVGNQYEELPREGMTRASSVRPLPRESNGFADERAGTRYVSMEQPRYRVVEPGERYYDAQGREVITQGPAQRY